jgi:uncharacterized damage-inducible protein DinB
MTVKDLEVLYDYGYWANKKLFDAIARLTPEQFTQPVAGSYGSIRSTLVHAMSAEWGWLDRCGGRERGAVIRFTKTVINPPVDASLFSIQAAETGTGVSGRLP